ncbi:MAG TPA: class I SAM-dependent methyltransferase [Candidatus Wunengus sp. YC60]|uniref:class I SAM-dependent methyltransferase n=1 Tax=Candidatus Wunengus sp. YC60 TaxID=3367697 RepID=UPI004028752C
MDLEQNEFYKNAHKYYEVQRDQENRRVYDPRVRLILESLNPKDSYIDVGCGAGVFVNEFAKEKPIMAIGLDVSHVGCKFGKDAQIKNAHYVVSDSLNIPFSSNSFDVVSCFGVLEHVENPQAVIDELIRILKPKGKLFLFIPQWFTSIGLFWFYYMPFIVLSLLFIYRLSNKLTILKLSPYLGSEWETSKAYDLSDLDACSLILGISVVGYI